MAQFESIPEIINLARRSNLESVADRLDYLYTLDVEYGDKPMNAYAANALVSFMIENPSIISDMITMDPDGFIHVTWSITPNSRLHAQFLPSGNVWFVHTLNEKDSDHFKVLKKGEAVPNDMLKMIIPFITSSM